MTAIALVHAFDPRGQKLGGLETYVRDFIRHCPPDIRLLVIGVDGRGDLAVGHVATLTLFGRTFEFLPVLAWPERQADGAARSLARSLTLRFALALLRHGRGLRRILRQGGFSIDNRKVEIGPIVQRLGVPVVQMMHDDGLSVPRDALIQRFMVLYRLAERASIAGAARFLCVNPVMAARLRAAYPRHADRIGTVTTWYDPDVLRPTPFATADGLLRLVYAGRLDTVKNPDLMFRTVAAVARRQPTEFHYVGGWDPERWPAFAAIRAVTVRHGFRTMAEQAAILSAAHVGLLTSHMEGMPRCVLEALGAGRPVAALYLPQLEAVLRPGSGALVARHASDPAEALAEAILGLWADIRAGRLSPEGIAGAVSGYTPAAQLGRVFAEHRALGAARRTPRLVPAAIR